MIAIQTSERNGEMVGAVLVQPSDEIMLITNTGVLVRTRVDEIREMGRATQGVTLINVDDGGRLSGVQRVNETDLLENDDETEDQAGEHPSASAESSESGADTPPDTSSDSQDGNEDNSDDPTV